MRNARTPDGVSHQLAVFHQSVCAALGQLSGPTKNNEIPALRDLLETWTSLTPSSVRTRCAVPPSGRAPTITGRALPASWLSDQRGEGLVGVRLDRTVEAAQGALTRKHGLALQDD